MQPKQVTVHVGDSLEWADMVPHRDRQDELGRERAARSGRMVMKAPSYHPNMTGEIIVEP